MRHWNAYDDDRDHHDDHHGRDDDQGIEFEFEIPEIFKIDLDNLNLKQLGKVTDFDVTHKHISVTLGNAWTFEVNGDSLDFTLKSGSKLPVINGGTVDSFVIDGPGKADFSISGLDLSAKAFYNALTSFNVGKLLDLVLGGDETISGSGFGDSLYAGKGDDTLFGNKGADYLLGGAGNDRISGGTGSDYLLGEKGADTFVFGPKSGMDLVADFDSGKDILDLTGYGLAGSVKDFLDANASGDDGCRNRHHGDGDGDGDDDDSVIIDLGAGNMVKLAGVSRWDLGADNVLL